MVLDRRGPGVLPRHAGRRPRRRGARRLAGVLDILGLGGLASLSVFVVFGGFAALFGLVGLAVAVGFPLALYVDARAIEAAGGEWRPDPVLWGLSAVVAVLVTNFVLSVPLALYYLYRRHEAIGTP
ncbi:hypothetical protein [Salinigranum sp. GCM10025319]|uniref:hypothetical protein n=1 Tax=Salinigranum sp. GCM10025319 TaxID=3252687 RepID=UPI00362303AE